VTYSVELRTGERSIVDDDEVLLRLGTDHDVDETIRSSLGHSPAAGSAM
jgi:hypothetical protein